MSVTALTNLLQQKVQFPLFLDSVSHPEQRRDLGYVNSSGHVVRPIQMGQQTQKTPRRQKATVVLGPQVLAEVRIDMSRRNIPGDVGRTTTRPGEVKWGKLTADEWKNLCVIHLPFTLTRLWGGLESSEDADDRRKYRMLRNYLHLVEAVSFATQDRLSEDTIQHYEATMQSYLEGLLDLYPGTHILPYQHLALHFGQHLRRWGPTRSWRCFAFERYNGMLQKTNTNRKFSMWLDIYLCHSSDLHSQVNWNKRCCVRSVDDRC